MVSLLLFQVACFCHIFAQKFVSNPTKAGARPKEKARQ